MFGNTTYGRGITWLTYLNARENIGSHLMDTLYRKMCDARRARSSSTELADPDTFEDQLMLLTRVTLTTDTL
ncbi:unnamed protein product [Cyberlindnera jadinii]|uniref:Uncharacterized protein n=1 Tax=Cyberlindnera jadinii (strain ATCC 18201 / CBS 1600 / BCRC 20928 / JCM 3617 / NBRC 0987 / NRRL Y-1542) TaxID=983966 RepID=A0A0H5C869_CYBJN|nr:unnamed protein product [Cyberlindnera jadinii]